MEVQSPTFRVWKMLLPSPFLDWKRLYYVVFLIFLRTPGNPKVELELTVAILQEWGYRPIFSSKAGFELLSDQHIEPYRKTNFRIIDIFFLITLGFNLFHTVVWHFVVTWYVWLPGFVESIDPWAGEFLSELHMESILSGNDGDVHVGSPQWSNPEVSWVRGYPWNHVWKDTGIWWFYSGLQQ